MSYVNLSVMEEIIEPELRNDLMHVMCSSIGEYWGLA